MDELDSGAESDDDGDHMGGLDDDDDDDDDDDEDGDNADEAAEDDEDDDDSESEEATPAKGKQGKPEKAQQQQQQQGKKEQGKKEQGKKGKGAAADQVGDVPSERTADIKVARPGTRAGPLRSHSRPSSPALRAEHAEENRRD